MSEEICRYLRTKKMYVPAQASEALLMKEGESEPHCWCNRTMTETGPDDQPVNRRDCAHHRSCFLK